MKIPLFFLIFITLWAFSQEYEYVPFPDSGAVWREIYYNWDEDSPDKTTREYFAVNGEDTIINDHVYSKLFIFHDSAFNKTTATCIGGIREDSLRRIYYSGDGLHFLKPNLECANNNEIKLFDFGVEVGDTIWSLNTYHTSNGLIVSNIDTILLGKTLRRKIYFELYDEADSFWGFSWIEGIGSTRGLLYISDDTPTSKLNHSHCFYQNNENVFLNDIYSDCTPAATGLTGQTINIDVKVYPNPIANNEARFIFDELSIEVITLYNGRGCIIRSVDVDGLNNVIIPMKNILPGLYFYVCKIKEGKIVSGKFLVQ